MSGTTEKEKILYVFFWGELIDPAITKFVDKFGVEYKIIPSHALTRFTYQGMPILQTMPSLVRKGKQQVSQMHEPQT